MAVLVLQQAGLHAGPLRACQPLRVIADPIVLSIALSVWLFDEHFTTNTAVPTTAAAALP